MTGNWLYNKSASDNNAFVRQSKPPWSIRAQHKKSAWSFKTWTLKIRVEYAEEDSCFWLSKWSLPIERSWGRCVSCAFQHWFPVVFVSDRIWPLKHFREFFDLFWSIKLFIAAKWPFKSDGQEISTIEWQELKIDFLHFLSINSF